MIEDGMRRLGTLNAGKVSEVKGVVVLVKGQCDRILFPEALGLAGKRSGGWLMDFRRCRSG